MGWFRPPPNKEADLAAAEVMRPAPLRWVLTLALALAVGAAFWWNFGRQMADLEAKTAFQDKTGSWTKEERRALGARAKLFREQWGIQVIAHVGETLPELPPLTPTTLFLGLAPGRNQATLVVPGLASQALRAESARQGKDMRLEMEQSLARCAQSSPSTAPCVMQALDGLTSLFTK